MNNSKTKTRKTTPTPKIETPPPLVGWLSPLLENAVLVAFDLPEHERESKMLALANDLRMASLMVDVMRLTERWVDDGLDQRHIAKVLSTLVAGLNANKPQPIVLFEMRKALASARKSVKQKAARRAKEVTP